MVGNTTTTSIPCRESLVSEKLAACCCAAPVFPGAGALLLASAGLLVAAAVARVVRFSVELRLIIRCAVVASECAMPATYAAESTVCFLKSRLYPKFHSISTDPNVKNTVHPGGGWWWRRGRGGRGRRWRGAGSVASGARDFAVPPFCNAVQNHFGDAWLGWMRQGSARPPLAPSYIEVIGVVEHELRIIMKDVV